MPRSFFQFVVLLLLVVQGSFASASVRVLCLPNQLGCESHEQVPVVACGHDAQDGAARCGGHEHRLLDMAAHTEAPCSCYVHVPVPGSEQSTSSHVQSRGDQPDLRVLIPPALVIAFIQWDLGPMHLALPAERPSLRCFSDSVLALQVTRLLI